MADAKHSAPAAGTARSTFDAVAAVSSSISRLRLHAVVLEKISFNHLQSSWQRLSYLSTESGDTVLEASRPPDLNLVDWALYCHLCYLLQKQSTAHFEVLSHPASGSGVTTADTWLKGRHQQLFHLFPRHCCSA